MALMLVRCPICALVSRAGKRDCVQKNKAISVINDTARDICFLSATEVYAFLLVKCVQCKVAVGICLCLWGVGLRG